MGRSQQTFNKSEREKKRLKKKKEKLERKEERKTNADENGGGLESMMAYVNEDGTLSDTPPDPTKKKKEINAENIVLGVPKKEEGDEVDAVRTGKIDFFNDSKGFGFIKETDSTESFFVHINGLIDEVHEGDKVSFELERGMKGMNAVNVKKI
jgi:cold shock CspA family protein